MSAITWRPTVSRVDAIELDVLVSATHVGTNEVTEHPVESGGVIGDHIRAKPDTLTIEGVISNSPIGELQSRRAAAAGFPDGAVRVGYAQDAYQRLLALKAAATLIAVVTPLRAYDDMAIESISVPETVQGGDALRFTMTLKHVAVVETQTTTVVARREAKGKRKTDLGNQPTVGAAAEERESILSKLGGSSVIKSFLSPVGG